MPINTLEYSKIFQEKLDNQIIEGATSGWMEQNSGQVKYTGGNEVKIPKITTQGLADYDRDEGFVQGSVALSYQTMKLGQDRGRTFQLDANDVDETNFVANAGNVMGVFQKEHVIPEIDSYRYSKIFQIAKGKNFASEGYTPDKTSILSKIRDDIDSIRDSSTLGVDLIIIMSPKTSRVLSDSLENSRRIDVGDFKQGSVNFKIKYFDEYPIIEVPSARLKTLYKKNDGKTSGQEVGGLAPDSTSKDINWIIVPRNVPIAISKTDITRIFDPMTNQNAHAWKIDCRKYHELWIVDSKISLIRANSN